MRIKKVKDLLTIKMIDIFSFSLFFQKRVKLLIKSGQRNKEFNPLDKYIKKPILKEFLTDFRVFG